MTMQGPFVAACPDEAVRCFSFLATAASTQLDRGLHLQIRFGIGRERDLSERELPHLSGWRGSAPVRTGNGAWQQSQLDVYGAVLDAAHTLRDELTSVDPDTRVFLIAAVDAAASRWPEDDQGVWEIRGPARAYLHSKLMCWVAVDRGLALRELLEPGAERTSTVISDSSPQHTHSPGRNDTPTSRPTGPRTISADASGPHRVGVGADPPATGGPAQTSLCRHRRHSICADISRSVRAERPHVDAEATAAARRPRVGSGRAGRACG